MTTAMNIPAPQTMLPSKPGGGHRPGPGQMTDCFPAPGGKDGHPGGKEIGGGEKKIGPAGKDIGPAGKELGGQHPAPPPPPAIQINIGEMNVDSLEIGAAGPAPRSRLALP